MTFMASYEAAQLKRLVERALGVKLTDRDRFILGNRLGWGGHKSLPQASIGRMLKTSQVQVSYDERALKTKLARAIKRREKNDHIADSSTRVLATLYSALAQIADEQGISLDEVRRIAEVEPAQPDLPMSG